MAKKEVGIIAQRFQHHRDTMGFEYFHSPSQRFDHIGGLNIQRCWGEIAYIQVGDNPGRKEPTTGEINYRNVFKYLYDKGYRGVVGMEHGKSAGGKEGELKLIAAYREADDFLR